MPVKFFICMLLRPTDAVLIASCRVSWNLKRPCRAVRTDLPHFPARVVVTPADAPHRFRGVERREETADDQVHADHGPSSAALRPPASASRSPHRERDRRHGPRRPSLDGAWLAGRGADGRGLSRCGRPHGAGAPTGGLEAAPTGPEAHGATPARAGRATNLRVSPHSRALAGRTRQDPDPVRVDRARAFVPLRALLRFLRVSPSRFHAWRRRQQACALDDQSSCPRTSPSRLTPPEVRAIQDMVTSPDYRHVPTGTLAVLAQRLGTVWASPSTWYRLVRLNGWRRPRLRVHPVKPKIGLRTTRANEMWHIDTTVIRLLDGTRADLHAVIDNFSRRILAWRVADTFAPVNSVTVLLDASRAATPSATTPVVLADAGVENVNAQVDDLTTPAVRRQARAFTELKFSNSMIEAWWRSLKHQWLFLHSLESAT